MNEGIVTYWGNVVNKMRYQTNQLPSSDVKTNLLKLLAKGTTHKNSVILNKDEAVKLQSWASYKIDNVDKIHTLLNEAQEMLGKCKLSDSISSYMDNKFNDIKQLAQKVT